MDNFLLSLYAPPPPRILVPSHSQTTPTNNGKTHKCGGLALGTTCGTWDTPLPSGLPGFQLRGAGVTGAPWPDPRLHCPGPSKTPGIK